MVENSDDFLVTKADWTSIESGERYCAAGVRALCAAHGVNYQEFIKNGVPYSRIKHIRNAMLDNVIAAARKRNEAEKANES